MEATLSSGVFEVAGSGAAAGPILAHRRRRGIVRRQAPARAGAFWRPRHNAEAISGSAGSATPPNSSTSERRLVIARRRLAARLTRGSLFSRQADDIGGDGINLFRAQ